MEWYFTFDSRVSGWPRAASSSHHFPCTARPKEVPRRCYNHQWRTRHPPDCRHPRNCDWSPCHCPTHSASRCHQSSLNWPIDCPAHLQFKNTPQIIIIFRRTNDLVVILISKLTEIFIELIQLNTSLKPYTINQTCQVDCEILQASICCICASTNARIN